MLTLIPMILTASYRWFVEVGDGMKMAPPYEPALSLPQVRVIATPPRSHGGAAARGAPAPGAAARPIRRAF